MLIMQGMQMPVFANNVRLGERIVIRGNASPRSPSRPLILEQNNYVLTLPNSEEKMLVRLLVGDAVVYEEFVSSIQETVEFPEYLRGEYQISLVMGDKEYVGTINL